MDFLIKLLAVETPENTTLQSAELTFRGLLPWWLMVPLLLALCAYVFFVYRSEKGTLGWPRRLLLIGIRSVLVGLLLLLILRPILLAEFEGQRPRGVALLLDNSQSMGLADRRVNEADQWRVAIANNLVPPTTKLTEKKSTPLPASTPKDPTRSAMVRAVFDNPQLKLVDGLQKFGPLRPYLFGADLRGVSVDPAKEGDPKLLEGFKADDTRTALADSIMKVLHSKDSDLPTAIVGVTDGQDNFSKYTLQEAALECARLKVPLHLYGVGSAEGGSLQFKEVAAPDMIFADDTISVPLRWRAQGFKKGTVEIALSLGGKQVIKKEIPVQAGEDLRDVLSFIVPKNEGKEEDLDLTATIQVKGQAGFKDTITQPLRVIDRKIKLLYVENAPRWEYKFLQPALLRDRRVDADFLLLSAADEVKKSGAPFLAKFPETREKFFDSKYNIIVLGDIPPDSLTDEQQGWIREFVERRGGLIVIAGRQHMPASYGSLSEKGKGSPIVEMLPVEFAAIKPTLNPDLRTQEYPPTLTETGLRTGMLSLGDTPEESQDVWQKQLLGFHWNFPVTKVKTGSTVLMVNPRAKMDDQPMPLMVSHYYGQGQVLFLGSDETWRWRWNHQDRYFIRFWGQIIYQMGLPSLLSDSAKRVQGSLQNSQAILGQPGTVYFRLLDKDFNPRTDSKVEVTLEHLDAKAGQERFRKYTLTALPGRPGEYSVLLPHDKPGRYEMKVNNPEPSTFSFRVDLPPRHELEESGLAEKTLRDAAQLSGGRFYREEDLSQLSASVPLEHVTFTRSQEVLLWNPLVLLLILLLLTVEWVLRKFADLA